MDSLLKRSDDQPTIGLLLCRDKNNIEVEFTLRDMNKPKPEKPKPDAPKLDATQPDATKPEKTGG